MANRYLRGTFVRTSWEFYELGAAYVFGTYHGGPGNIGLYLRNNGIGQSYLDLYRAELSTSAGSSITWAVAPPNVIITGVEPDTYLNAPIQSDLGSPPGDMVAFTGPLPAGARGLKQRTDQVTYDFIELANGGPFLSVPSNYGLAVVSNLTAAGTISMTVWYQSITDHVAPAS
jgi:hypothetical protein